MLCPACHVHTKKGFPFCLRCGQPIARGDFTQYTPAMLYSPEGDQGFPLSKYCTTVGRSSDNDLVITDKYVSRYHCRVWREPNGYRLEDLDSMNGTYVNNERMQPGSSRSLRDYDVLGVGPTTMVRLEQPRSADIGGKTMISVPEQTIIGTGISAGSGPGTVMTQATVGAGGPATASAAPQSPLDMKPRRRSGWAMKQVASQDQNLRFVLRNTRTGQYLQLTERDAFLWNLMDGGHSVRDLLFGYARQYGQLALPRIQQLIDQLYANDLIAKPASLSPQERGMAQRVADRVVGALLRLELAISGLDAMMEKVYRSWGWRFFTPAGLGLIWMLAIGGILVFVFATRKHTLLDVGGAGIIGLIAAVLGYSLSLTVHELAHALATKSYGRKVPRGGFMIMMGMPYAFVDTTDMWFEPSGPRIVVSMAGPVATTALAFFFSAFAAFIPNPVASGISFQIAFGLYVNTLFNFNPLIPLDGYYVLSDWLQMPRLREEAQSYFTSGIWRDLRNRERLGRRQVGLAAYGMVAVVGMFLFLLLGIFTWNTRLGGFVHEHVPPPFDTVITVGLLLLLFFPVWFSPVSRIIRAVRRRMSPEQGQVEMGASPA